MLSVEKYKTKKYKLEITKMNNTDYKYNKNRIKKNENKCTT